MFRWPPLDVSTAWRRGIGPQVNKFEQVSSDDHQLSVVGEEDTMVTWGLPWTEWQTDTFENITFPQLRLPVVSLRKSQPFLKSTPLPIANRTFLIARNRCRFCGPSKLLLLISHLILHLSFVIQTKELQWKHPNQAARNTDWATVLSDAGRNLAHAGDVYVSGIVTMVTFCIGDVYV